MQQSYNTSENYSIIIGSILKFFRHQAYFSIENRLVSIINVIELENSSRETKAPNQDL